MSVHTARFLAAAADARGLPRLPYPEVAFAGRSNVGKSSLLNRLVGQNRLARVSKTPGRTQQINFFLVDERVTFVDLPGYGFARVPVPVKLQWKALVETYLAQRRGLRGVVVLVDLRRGIESDDALLLDYLRAHRLPTLVVGTKADKLGRAARTAHAKALIAAVAPDAAVISCSAMNGEGIDDLWKGIAGWLS
jgi:GTP-binding protein